MNTTAHNLQPRPAAKTVFLLLSGALFCAIVLPVSSPAQERLRRQDELEKDLIQFHISLDEARKYNAAATDEYVSEFGDASGPFLWVGTAVVDGDGVGHFDVTNGAQVSGSHPGIDDPEVEVIVEYFLNEEGRAFGVIRKRPVGEANDAAEKEKEEIDERPYEHVELCNAASFAIWEENLELLKALINAGFDINIPLDFEFKATVLHRAASSGKLKAAKFLRENGARLDARDEFGQRPIDYAFEDRNTEMCELLRWPETFEEPMIGDYPRALIAEIVNRGNPGKDEGLIFLSLNGSSPGEDLLKFVKVTRFPNALPRSRAELFNDSYYRDTQTGEYGDIVEMTLTPIDADNYDWKLRFASGPSLAGGGAKGKIHHKYGYWIIGETIGWDE